MPTPPAVPGVTLDGWPGDAGAGEVWAATLDDGVPAVARLVRMPPDPTRRSQAATAGQRLTELRHPHLAPVLAVEEIDEGLAVVTAQVAEAVSLQRLLAARGRLEPGEVVTIGLPIAQALTAAHAAGFAHGALTPADILLEPNGRPQLVWVGIAGLRAIVDGGLAPTAAADVYDLADLLLDTMARATGPDAAAVAVAVATALVPDPTRRPAAAELASALAHSARPAPVQMISPPPPVPPPGEISRIPLGMDGAAGGSSTARPAGDEAGERVSAIGLDPDDPDDDYDDYEEDDRDDEGDDDGYSRHHDVGARLAPPDRAGTDDDDDDDDVVDAVIMDAPVLDGAVVEGAVVDPDLDVVPMLPRQDPAGPRFPGTPRPPGLFGADPRRGRAPAPSPAHRSQRGSALDTGRGPATVPRAVPRPADSDTASRPGGAVGGRGGHGPDGGRPRARPARQGSRGGRGRGRLPRWALVVTGLVGIVVVVVAAVLLNASGDGTPGQVGAAMPGVTGPGGASGSGPGTRPPTSAATASQSPEKAWETVLAGLDAARGRAFEKGDESALKDVYEVGSAVYAADLASLRQVTGQGGHASGLSLHVLDLQIQEQTSDRAVLRVTEQLGAYEILDSRGNVLLRKEQAVAERHDVTLVRTAGGWRISDRVLAP